VAQLLDLAGSGALSEHLFDGIAGHNVNEQKNESEHEPKGRQGEQEAMEKVAGYASANSALLFPGGFVLGSGKNRIGRRRFPG
jgi:hypothetical protein